ncbi:MAG: thiol:disulfide interchange protein DsbA/DsbL [Steroidobacteraceae bacterium]
MNRSGILVLLLLVSVSACAKDPAPPPAGNGAQPSAATTPAPSSAKTEIETATQESGGDAAEPGERGDAGLERLAALPADQQLPNGRWKAGAHYMPLVPAQPTNVGAGEVEVVEVFWYGCNHCYALEPFLASWDKANAEYVKLVKVPVVWSQGHRAHARLFYTFEALGRRDLHQKVFDMIHQRGNQLLGKSERDTQAVHVDFAKANGIDPQQFLQAYDSFSVNSNLQRAERLTESYRVQGVPLMVVNGKYTTDVGMAGGQTQLLALLTDLAASEKR